MGFPFHVTDAFSYEEGQPVADINSVVAARLMVFVIFWPLHDQSKGHFFVADMGWVEF